MKESERIKPRSTQWRRRNFVFLMATVFMTIYLIWRAFFTLPWQGSLLARIGGVLLLGAEIITSLTTFELYARKRKDTQTQRTCPKIPDHLYPDVDIFIATHNEAEALLYKTVNACTFLDYPDKEKVHIYLCDDGDRPAIEALAQKLGVGYLGLSGNTTYKSGNLNHALACTHSPLVVTFDADMIPQHSFLLKTIPYFVPNEWIADENGKWRRRTEAERETLQKIGLIQTPQSFYNPDLFQFNLYAQHHMPNEQDFFSREINVMRNAANAIAYTGSNTVLLRSAMEEIGGFPIHTITEDFETSIRMQQAGYRTYATREVLAAGLSTTNIRSMVVQRKRWARGVIQSLWNTGACWSRKLPLQTRISYLTGFFYWWSFANRLIFIVAPILFALFGVQLVVCSFWQIMLFWLPAHLLYGAGLTYLSSNLRNLYWSQVFDTIFAPFLVVPVFLETVGIREKRFVVTQKESEAKKGKEAQSEKESQNRNKNAHLNQNENKNAHENQNRNRNKNAHENQQQNQKENQNKNTQSSFLRFAFWHLLLFVLSLVAFVHFAWGKFGFALLYSSVILYWLFVNLRSIVFALFFMLGRDAPRKADRIDAQVAVEICRKGQTYAAKTLDLSDAGLRFALEDAVSLVIGETLTLHLTSPRYHAAVTAHVVRVCAEVKEQDAYAVRIEPQSEEDRRHYLQLIYDRPHSLPTELDRWMTAYDDLMRNIAHRLATWRAQLF